jgi:hypothetical protein
LTISPNAVWKEGYGNRLNIQVANMAGTKTIEPGLRYDVYNLAALTYVYVSDVDGDDAMNDGLTPGAPKQTINAGIDAATAGQFVLVAGGLYEVDSDAGSFTQVIMGAPHDGIRVYGGWSDDFGARDTCTWSSNIKDLADDPAGSGRAVDFTGAGVGPATVFSGFTVNGGNAGIFNDAIQVTGGASPVLLDNIVHGGNGQVSRGISIRDSSPRLQGNQVFGGSSTVESHGISIRDSSPIISHNVIDGGPSDFKSVGIWDVGSGTTEIRNNIVLGGMAGTHSMAFQVSGSDALLQNNVFIGGEANYSWGIHFVEGGMTATNNIVTTVAGTIARVCVSESNQMSEPTWLNNNDLFDCPSALYANNVGMGNGNCTFNDGLDCLTEIAEVNALTDFTGGVGGNISQNPLFTNPAGNNFHLTPASPLSVREGGLDLSLDFTDDLDDVTRTVPWSMGSYEQD